MAERKMGLVTVSDEYGKHRFVLTVKLNPTENPEHFQTIEHTDLPDDAMRLSLMGEVVNLKYRRSSANFDEGGGQNIDSLREMASNPAAVFDEGITREWCLAVADIWDRWHLNDLRAGCAHQKVKYETDRYGRRVPSLSLTPVCPVSDYKYGHAWLYEPLPKNVLRWAQGFTAGATEVKLP